jgi:hypothetical protein
MRCIMYVMKVTTNSDILCLMTTTFFTPGSQGWVATGNSNGWNRSRFNEGWKALGTINKYIDNHE